MRESVNNRQEEALVQMHEVLGDEFLSLAVLDYELSERFDAGRCELACRVEARPAENVFRIAGTGVGMVDAFFHGVCERYESEHPSLQTIRFTNFSVRGLMSDAPTGGQASDAQAEARIGVTNSYGNEFEFAAVTPSVSRSSLEAVLAAVEYFVNSERAYVRAYVALEQAKLDERADRVAKYTALLASLIRNTSHSEAIDRAKKSMLGTEGA